MSDSGDLIAALHERVARMERERAETRDRIMALAVAYEMRSTVNCRSSDPEARQRGDDQSEFATDIRELLIPNEGT